LLKKTLKIFTGIILGLVVLVVIAAIYYQFDEELDPDIVRLVNNSPEVIDASKNGYYQLLGLYAGENKKPVEYALEIIEQARKQSLEKDVVILPDPDLKRPGELHITAENKFLCYSLDRDCLGMVKKEKAKIKKILKDNALITHRFRNAYSFDDFQEPPYLFGLQGILTAHHLVLTDIAFEWLYGDRDKALNNLNTDLAFWRRVTRSDVSLITRMIAVANIGNTLDLWSEIVTDCGGCGLDEEHMTALERPLTAAELSLRKVFANEYRYMYKLSENALQEEIERSTTSKILYALFYKKNSTLNKIRHAHKEIIHLSECDFQQYVECVHTYQDTLHDEPVYWSWEFVDNPIGTILAAIAQPAYTGYAQASFEQEVRRRLILAKLQIYKNNIKPVSIQAQLDDLPHELRNPFDDSAIKWNAKSKTLVITAGEDDRIKVSVNL
jgi:hypothetical protein